MEAGEGIWILCSIIIKSTSESRQGGGGKDVGVAGGGEWRIELGDQEVVQNWSGFSEEVGGEHPRFDSEEDVETV